MKKKFLTLIALLLSASLVTACNEETSSADPANNGTSNGGNNYGDVSGNNNSVPSDSSDSNGGNEDQTNEFDQMIAEFVSDVNITVPSTASFNLEEYEVLYYYAYEQYVLYAAGEDDDEAFAEQYAALFTTDTNLTCLNDENYPVEDYGYYYADSEQNIVINFYSEQGHFVIAIYRYDGLAGSLDVSNVDTSWYVDYINFDGYELIETSITSLIPNYLEITAEISIPQIDETYVAGLCDPSIDEDGYQIPGYFSIVVEGDKMLDYAAKLETAGYHVDLNENKDVTIDWDTYELVEYTYYTVSAYDSGRNIYITIELDKNENTLINFYNFADIFVSEKADNTDWTNTEKELMNSTLHQLLPFMQFGSDYLVFDASDEEWTLFIIQDSYYEDLTADYIDLLLKAGFFIDDTTWDDTYYCLDNGLVYIEIYIEYNGGNYLEVYYEDSHLEPLTSFSLDQTALDIVAGASYQLTPIYNPSSAVHPTTWSSSNENVATVSETGLVTINSNATADSSAVITATTISGKTASCTFTVKANEVTGIAFKQDNYDVLPGAEPFVPEYYFLPYGVTGSQDVTFAINPDNVGINYDSTGKLSASDTAVVGITATITVTCGSAADTATVTVVPATITHTLDRDFFGIVKANYSKYLTYKKTTSDGASYEACAAGNDGIQLRSKSSDSGIIGHFEGRACKSITITFDPNTEVPNKERKVDIYASNSPFTIEDMFGDSVTKVGTITFDKNNLTQTYTFTDSYSYIGLRSADGAVYLPSIQIVW